MFQALEAYDRRIRLPSPEKVQEHQQRVERILGVVGNEDRKWLKDKLRQNEPNAKDRILSLLKSVEGEWLLNEADIELAANLRNFYTHYSPDVEARLPPEKERPRAMYNLAVRLRVLCEMLLLKQLGQRPDWMRERIKKTRRLERRLIP